MKKNMSRAERQIAIVKAVYIIENNGSGHPATSYRICQQMGVTRQTRLYLMMLDMVDDGILTLQVEEHRPGWLKAVFGLTGAGRSMALRLMEFDAPKQKRVLKINGSVQSCLI